MAQQPSTNVGAPAAQPSSDAPTAPFVLSLIAGILMLAGVGMMLAFAHGTHYSGMMGGYYGMMQGFGYGGWWFYGAALLGLIAGIVVLVGAIMIYARPSNAPTWGLLILVFSVLSFFGMGGFFVGAILGIVGGVLAMTLRPGAVSR